MSPAPDRYAVIGHPVEHSRSPDIHRLFAEQCAQTMDYTRLPAPVDGFERVAGEFFAAGGAGLNVTLPFKTAAAELADRLTERARRAGAVNTLMASADGLVGDNTDGAGLVADLVDNLGVAIAGRRLLILGAGGAVRGVVPNLLAAGAARITIANRSADKARAIADACADMGAVSACALDAAPADADLVINAISAGLTEGSMPAIDARVLARAGAVYDLIYADAPTPFLRWAAEHGVTAGRDGFGMLVEQAAESFALWRGIRPATAPVIAALRDATRRPG
ncbi:shikimate dehydrogenase [Salinisphaera sp. LB1]|uniref:shikimate dehydrogenase n=1 Tax=Salinisphaera sp. LB1 TaxID=2183911 RepID=UPI000D705A49|nr:shikimate dehydrogenase [Salinisphaera sp. LB1]AWN14699.1 Shikimate 5-dehydrogenase I alpha [Salinisphaera sp. LB1]